MKEWWMNLSLREKQTISMGGFIIILFLLYEIIYSPFTHKIARLRQEVQHNHELLNFMKNTDQQLRTLTKTSQENQSRLQGSLLSAMQNEISQSPFARQVTTLHQAENNSVQLNLQKISFDQLITWLTTLSKQYGFIVSQITITPIKKPGEVHANMVIKSN